MSDDDERFRNLLIYKFYGTDKEFEEIAPFLGICFLIFILIFVPYAVCNNKKAEKPPQTIEKIEKKKEVEKPPERIEI